MFAGQELLDYSEDEGSGDDGGRIRCLRKVRKVMKVWRWMEKGR
jgi:hypothetical protein